GTSPDFYSLETYAASDRVETPRRTPAARKDFRWRIRATPLADGQLTGRMCRSEDESGRLGKSRQQRGRGIEHRTAAHHAAGRAVNHGLARQPPALDAYEAPAILELIEQHARR